MTRIAEPLEKLTELTREDRVVTIGTFDGVHRGHQMLVRAATERAHNLALPLTVITFDPPPIAVLRPDRFAGTVVTTQRKVELLKQAGADSVVVLPFTHALAALTAVEFLDALVVPGHVRELFVGEGFALGHNREGTVDVLTSLGGKRGIRVVALTRVESNGVIVSSSAIRRAIMEGDAGTASRMLGRKFRIEGEVIHGAHVGRTIGYPTANVLPPEGQIQLADGIYASLTHLPGRSQLLPAMTYIGTRPALNTGRRLIETHILDFDGDLYGHRIFVEFVERLRADADFPTVDQLIAQLRHDEAQTRIVHTRLGRAAGLAS